MHSRLAPFRMQIGLNNRLMVVVTAGSLVLAVSAGLAEVFYLFYLLAFLWAAAYAWTRWAGESVSLHREPETNWTQVGDEFSESFSVHNHSHLPMLWLEVLDHSDVPGYSANRIEAVQVQETRSWASIGVCLRRGLYNLGPTELRTGDPFGLFVSRLLIPATRSLLVFPPIVHLPELQLPPGSATGASRSHIRTAQPTSSVAGVRNYLPGDPVSRISWRHTAHTGELQVKESELEPSRSLWVVLDLDQAVQLGEGEQSTLEIGVKVAASVAYRAISEGRAVGLAAGLTRVQPERGARQMRRILETLAMVTASPDLTLIAALAQLSQSLMRGASVVVVTPSLDPVWVHALLNLAQRGLAPASILLDPGLDGKAPDEAYAALTARLWELGVPGCVIRGGELLASLMPGRKKRRARYRILGTGRAALVEAPEKTVSPLPLRV